MLKRLKYLWRAHSQIPLERTIRLVHALDKKIGPELEGHEMLAVEVELAHIDDSTVLYVPDLSLVGVGDVSLNDMHLASREPDGRNARSMTSCTRNDCVIEACYCHPITDSLG